MKVFVGCSTEARDRGVLSTVSTWISRIAGVTDVIRWDTVGLFPLGKSAWETLLTIVTEVDAAVFIMAPEDATWHREALVSKARDNEVLEYGLFAGALGPSRVVMCVEEDTQLASDVKGITFASLANKNEALEAIELWLKSLLKSEGVLSKGEIESIYVQMLRLIITSGTRDPNVDYQLAYYEKNFVNAKSALNDGADKQKTIQAVLQEHLDKMLDNANYQELVAKLRTGSKGAKFSDKVPF